MKFFTARRVQNKQKQIEASVIRIVDATGVAIRREAANNDIPISEYRKMLRDPEVSGDLVLKKLLMIPLLRVEPFDGDEKSKRAAEFIIAIEKKMPGSPISVYRDQALHEALTTGAVYAELILIKTDLPGFGTVLGIEDISIANSEDFEGNTKLDEYGCVKLYVQRRGGMTEFTPDEILHYGYKAITGNPEGISALYAAYNPYILKTEALANLKTSTTTSTTGLKMLDIPNKQYLERKEEGLSLLEGITRTGNLVKPDDWKINFDFPGNTTLYSLTKVVQEMCDKPIRKAILYDETITAEGMNSWNAGTSEESQNMVIATMKAEGDEFCESFIEEQVYRRILDANGMQDYPTPRAVSVPMLEDKDPTIILTALGTAKTNRIITGEVRPEEQDAIIKKLLSTIDIDSQGLLPAAIVAPDETVPLLQAARAPADRQKSVIKEDGVALQKHQDEATATLAENWDSIVPDISKALIKGLFDGGNWKTTNLGTIRELIKSKIKTDGKKLRDTMSDAMFSEWKDTYDKTVKSLPDQKLHATVNVGINPVRARQALRQRVYLMLEKTYGDISADLYYMLEDAVIGTTTPAAAQAQIQDYLLSKGINPSRARVLMDTALSHAHNSGRMAVYKPLEDPFGADPGSIIGYQYVSMKGAFKEPICIGMENQFFRCNDSSMPNPPLHFACSGSLVPVFAGEEPWSGGQFLDTMKSGELINAHGGVQSGFGG